jgi:hypothetical protein
MSILSLAIAISLLALWAIFFWHLCEFIAMPQGSKFACQLLIALVAILASLQMLIGTGPSINPSSHVLPSIISPEKK